MNELNAPSRSVYIAGNLNFLKSLDTQTIDLVCCEPEAAPAGLREGRCNRCHPDATQVLGKELPGVQSAPGGQSQPEHRV